MQELALGYLGWSVAEFWDATPRELMNAYRGKFNREESYRKEEWERWRWSTSVLITPHVKKGRKVGPRDLIEFPWERKRPKKIADLRTL